MEKTFKLLVILSTGNVLRQMKVSRFENLLDQLADFRVEYWEMWHKGFEEWCDLNFDYMEVQQKIRPKAQREGTVARLLITPIITHPKNLIALHPPHLAYPFKLYQLWHKFMTDTCGAMLDYSSLVGMPPSTYTLCCTAPPQGEKSSLL